MAMELTDDGTAAGVGMDFRSIFRHSPVPAMVLDRDLVFVATNDAYCEMVSKRPEEMIGRYVFDAFPETPERIEAMTEVFRRALAGERPAFREIPFSIMENGVMREHWWTAHHGPVAGPSGDIEFMVQFSENVTGQVRLREMKTAVVNELQHRIGNLFAVAMAMARRAARHAPDARTMLRDYEAHMDEFLHAQQHLIDPAHAAGDLKAIVERQMSIFTSGGRDGIVIEGPEYPLTASAAQAVSMLIHELGTNSLKYGGLGMAGGQVSVTWQRTGDTGLGLRWRETGEGVGEHGKEAGYGTDLLTKILPRQLGGVAERRFDGQVFEYTITIGTDA